MSYQTKIAGLLLGLMSGYAAEINVPTCYVVFDALSVVRRNAMLAEDQQAPLSLKQQGCL